MTARRSGHPLRPTFSFTGLTCGTTYTLGVAAVDAAGNVSGTATKSATTAACADTTPPSTPTGLATSAIGTDRGDPFVDRLDRQRRRHRLPALPGRRRRSARSVADQLRLHRPHLRDHLHARRRRRRRRRQRLRHRHDERHHGRLPGHHPAIDAGGPRRWDRQDRRPLSLSWNASTDNVGVTGYRMFQNGSQVGTSHLAGLHLRRAVVRHELHARRSGSRRRGERLGDCVGVGLDVRLLGRWRGNGERVRLSLGERFDVCTW